MKLIVISKDNYIVIPYDDITSITYTASTDTLTIVADGTSHSFTYSNYLFMMD